MVECKLEARARNFRYKFSLLDPTNKPRLSKAAPKSPEHVYCSVSLIAEPWVDTLTGHTRSVEFWP